MSQEILKSAHRLSHPVSIQGVRGLKKIIKFVFLYPLTLLDNIFATRKSQVISVSGHEGLKVDLPLIIYVHYSSQNVISEREKLTLLELQKIGFQTCLVMNLNENGPTVDYSVDGNRQFFDAIFLRKNIGYDLAAYRDILKFLQNHLYLNSKQIYFMNNSVVWFPEMMESYFKNLQGLEADIVAASISNQYIPHIQTYFFGSKTESGLKVIQNCLFSLKNWRLKRTVVSRGELSTNSILSLDLKIATFPSDSLVRANALRKLVRNSSSIDSKISAVTLKRLKRNVQFAFAGIPVNPSHSFWLENLEAGFPGIKIDLIKNNPSSIEDYSDIIKKLVELGFDFDEINKLIYSNKNRSMTLWIRQQVKW